MAAIASAPRMRSAKLDGSGALTKIASVIWSVFTIPGKGERLTVIVPGRLNVKFASGVNCVLHKGGNPPENTRLPEYPWPWLGWSARWFPKTQSDQAHWDSR